MNSVPVEGGELFYLESGEGRPVVLLHGGALDLRMWDELAQDLQSDYRVIRFDARGHGQSSTPTAPFRQCDDVAALLRHLQLKPAALVGLSMGAGAATDTTLEYPDLVATLVVSGAGTNEPTFTDPWILEQKAIMNRAEERQDAATWTDTFVTMGLVGPHRTLADLDPAMVTRYREMVITTIGNHVRPDAVPPTHVKGSWERLGEIAVPAMAIAGGVDSDDHLAMVHRFATNVAGCREIVIDGAAHMANMERPAEFAAAVRSILAA